MHVSIKPEVIFHIGNFSVTNTLITAWAVVILIIALSFLVYRGLKQIPGRKQAAAELIVEKLLGFMETVAGDTRTARRFFPIVATIFIFVLAANWVGILPGVGSIGFFEKIGEETEFAPLFRSAYSDLNMTIALALIAVTLSHFFGIISVGFWAHVKKFINPKSPIDFFTGILEIVSEFAKILSFSFRLFGNVFAGEVLLVIISFLVPYVVPTPFLVMELFVGLIQALIFSVLAMVAFSSFSKVHH